MRLPSGLSKPAAAVRLRAVPTAHALSRAKIKQSIGSSRARARVVLEILRATARRARASVSFVAARARSHRAKSRRARRFSRILAIVVVVVVRARARVVERIRASARARSIERRAFRRRARVRDERRTVRASASVRFCADRCRQLVTRAVDGLGASSTRREFRECLQRGETSR